MISPRGLQLLLQGGSADFRKANPSPGRAGPAPKLERRSADEPLAENKNEARHPGRYLVRLCSVRKRLLDEDNLSCKAFVDALRYGGLLPQDSPDVAKIEVSQRKVQAGEKEHVVVEIFKLSV